MKCYAGVKRCAWSFGGCIITRLDVGRNAERKYAKMAALIQSCLFLKGGIVCQMICCMNVQKNGAIIAQLKNIQKTVDIK